MTSKLEQLSSSDLVKLYNEAAVALKKPKVRRFSDHKTAVRRTHSVIIELETTPPAELKLTPRRPRPGFNFPFKGPLKAMRDGTLRALLAEKMREGATLPELAEIVEKYDRARGKEPHNIPERVYGGVRLLHFYVGYGVRQDQVTKKLHLIEAAAP